MQSIFPENETAKFSTLPAGILQKRHGSEIQVNIFILTLRKLSICVSLVMRQVVLLKPDICFSPQRNEKFLEESKCNHDTQESSGKELEMSLQKNEPVRYYHSFFVMFKI